MPSTMKQYEAKMAYLRSLLGGECEWCGTTERLEFDHIDRTTKSFSIAPNWGRSMAVLLPELAKCQLLCADCHDEKGIAAGDEFRVPHGRSGYRNRGCRCDICCEAHRKGMAEYRARKRATG